jgi:hypothetical protein
MRNLILIKKCMYKLKTMWDYERYISGLACRLELSACGFKLVT